MRIYATLLALMAIVVVTASASDVPRSPFDRVASGEIVVYPIGDLTSGQQQLADRLTGMLKDTIDSGSWKGEWRAAAMRSTPQNLTVKAEGSLQESIAKFLGQLRQTRNLFIHVNYQLVSAPGEIDSSKVINSRQYSAFKNINRIVAGSEATISNGDEATLIDGVDLPFPTIAAAATVSADRTAVTFVISAKNPTTSKNTMKSVVFSLSLNDSAGVPIPTASGTDWLILQPQLVERHWTPVGTALLIDRG